MSSLSLKTEQVEGDGTRISWNDVVDGENAMWVGLCLSYPIAVLIIFLGVGPTHSGALPWSAFVAFFTFWLPGVPIGWMLKAYAEREQPRSLSVLPKALEYEGNYYHLDQISRVEYGRKGDWDTSDPQTRAYTQVRIWFEDSDFIVVSENNWTREINHRLHSKIQDVVGQYQRKLKDIAYADQEAQKGIPTKDSGGFGIPDY